LALSVSIGGFACFAGASDSCTSYVKDFTHKLWNNAFAGVA
jgi:hypothetical protein